MEVDDGNFRLEFSREQTTLQKVLEEKDKFITKSLQGTFFYEYNGVIYTQKRVLGKFIYIRGKEIPIDDIKESFRKIKEAFVGIAEENLVFVIIYSRKDLLITHRYDIIPQSFFIGCLRIKNGETVNFIPAYDFYVPNTASFNRYNIEPIFGYEIKSSQNSKNPVFIPMPFSDVSKITHQDLVEGIVIRGIKYPISYYDAKTLEIMDFFSNTQNNTQLFIKMFFTESNGEKDRKLIFEKFRSFLPLEKEIEFTEWNIKYETFVSKIKNSPRVYNFVNNMGNLTLNLEDDIHENAKQKVEKTIMLLNTHLRFNLKKKTQASLQNTIGEGIYTFFTYSKNNNNACKILKFSENINLN